MPGLKLTHISEKPPQVVEPYLFDTALIRLKTACRASQSDTIQITLIFIVVDYNQHINHENYFYQ